MKGKKSFDAIRMAPILYCQKSIRFVEVIVLILRGLSIFCSRVLGARHSRHGESIQLKTISVDVSKQTRVKSFKRTSTRYIANIVDGHVDSG